MTLKEKFEQIFIEDFSNDWKKECEQIADEFAIGFAEWCNKNYEFYHGDAEYYSHTESKWYKIKELLEIYKKEKGL